MKFFARGIVWLWVTSIGLLYLTTLLDGRSDDKNIPLIKVDVGVVFIKVSVTDTLNRLVDGLEKTDFIVYEDSVRQTITHFSQESAPISMGIIFDISGSMASKLFEGRNAFSQLMRWDNPNAKDEYFLITFNSTVDLFQSFTNERSLIGYEMELQKAGGWTALYDAVYRGIDMVKRGRNEKKALILISDGEENKSRYSKSEVCQLAEESDVQIYTIGLGRNSILKELARITGGRAFFQKRAYGEINYVFNFIHSDLRCQYLLGYVPTNSVHDGKWRKIKVLMNRSSQLPKLNIRTREGRLAPKS